MILARGLRKTFFVHKKQPGLMGSVKSLFHRRQIARHAVKGVDFDIGEGEIVGLLGSNGAGKTTIVKMLAGIIKPSGGEARVLGHEPWKRDDRFRSQIALIMGQKAQLWWDLPAADCFLLLREIYRLPQKQYEKNLERLAGVLGVEEYLNVQIRRLSLGERMKMELIAALLHDPRVIFLDEPTIGLDVSAQRAIREFLVDYQRERQPAVILTSHYMEDIEHLCQRIMMIRRGEIVYRGSLDELVRTYASHKIVSAVLEEGSPRDVDREALERAGAILQLDGTRVRLEVDRGAVPAAVAHLIDQFSVVDITIEEEPVGKIIGAIQESRGEEAAPDDEEDEQ